MRFEWASPLAPRGEAGDVILDLLRPRLGWRQEASFAVRWG